MVGGLGRKMFCDSFCECKRARLKQVSYCVCIFSERIQSEAEVYVLGLHCCEKLTDNKKFLAIAM